MTEPAEARRGAITTGADGRPRLEFRRSWARPVEEVWAAITRPERMVRWIGTFDGDRRPGGTGTFTMTHEPEPASAPLTIEVCEPPHRLVVSWGQADGAWRVHLDLSADAGRTVLRFVQFFAPGTDVADVAGGWHWYLDKLDATVGGTPAPPEWDAFWAEVGPEYARHSTDRPAGPGPERA